MKPHYYTIEAPVPADVDDHTIKRIQINLLKAAQQVVGDSPTWIRLSEHKFDVTRVGKIAYVSASVAYLQAGEARPGRGPAPRVPAAGTLSPRLSTGV